MKVHEIKLLEDYCDEVYSGEKTFEVRKNDRGYQKGDHISFIPVDREYEQFYHPVSEEEYEITYVHSGLGLKKGYVALSLKALSSMKDSTTEDKIISQEEKSMKVLREVEVETNRLQVGDRIEVSFSGEKHYATAIQQKDDAMLFLTDDYLDDVMSMNPTDTTEGDWEESELRKRLQDIAENTDIKDQLVPFENGDLLTLLSIQEMFGLDEHFNKCDGQIEWMKDRRHRIALRKGDEYEWGWLRSVVSASHFASVAHDGNANSNSASGAFGVCPAFAIKI